MSPYELSILLDIYIGRPIRENNNAPIYPETIATLQKQNWIVGGIERQPLCPSAKLVFFMEHILTLPQPVSEWRMP